MESDERISTAGMLIHDHDSWPCAMCRPQTSLDGRGSLLCVDCAAHLVSASFARLAPDSNEMPGSDPSDAGNPHGSRRGAEWDLVSLALLDAEDR